MDASQLLSTVESKSKDKETLNKKVSPKDKSFNNVMDSISSNWTKKDSHLESEMNKLKRELDLANKKVRSLQEKTGTLTKNEEKIISAIKSESLIQKTDYPNISYNKFRKEYRVSSDYYRPSVKSLIAKGLIKKKEVIFSGSVKTFQWKLITT